MSTLYSIAEKEGINLLTAAEFAGRKNEMLEALRKELYLKDAQCKKLTREQTSNCLC